MKSTRKLKLARESIRVLTRDALLHAQIAGGARSGPPGQSCVSCEPSGIIACKVSQIFEDCA